MTTPLKLLDCRISHVNIRSDLCNISVKTSSVDNIYLDLDKFDKIILKEEILSCAGLKGLDSDACDASVIGIALLKGTKPKFQDSARFLNFKE